MYSRTVSNPTSLAAATTHALSRVLRASAALFQPSTPVGGVRASHLWWLGALMCAAAVVRLWGLDNVGFHGDEETMALAVRHILIDGRPILPSGMFYPRGMTQQYLMALSTSIFGESEWALRLPSVVCGVALVGLTFIVGRRFLRPAWSVALAASVAFLPDLIIDSQTARMYIFLVTSITAYMACVFAWERSDRIVWLIAAVAILIIGIDFQVLAIAATLMLLLPGVLKADMRKLVYGVAAMVVVGLGFIAINGWTGAQYPTPPPEFAAGLGAVPWERSYTPRDFALKFDIAMWAIGFVIALSAIYVARAVPMRPASFASALLLLAGVGLQLALLYHLAALFYVAGAVIRLRYGGTQTGSRLLILGAVFVSLLAVFHAVLLAVTEESVIKLVGAMVGQPSVWPYVRVAQLGEVAGLLTGGLLGWGLYCLASNRPVPDYWLVAVFGVWAPVFALGLFAWNVPPRYTEVSLPPMLLCAFAFAQHGTDSVRAWLARQRNPIVQETLGAAVVAVLVVNPASAMSVINAGYLIHPDHKGAAQFIQSHQITDDDILLAEDVLQQTYYLGKVDYWLIGPHVARKFVKAANGGVVDFYTGTPVISTPEMLDNLLKKNPEKRIFVIGSGEDQNDGRRTVRGSDLHEIIESQRFEVLFVGRDGTTRILRPKPYAVASTQSASVLTLEPLARDATATWENISAVESKVTSPDSAME